MKIEPSTLTRLVEAKAARRRRLAELPFPEKVKIVARLQAMAAPVLRRRGHKVEVWQMDGPDSA